MDTSDGTARILTSRVSVAACLRGSSITGRPAGATGARDEAAAASNAGLTRARPTSRAAAPRPAKRRKVRRENRLVTILRLLCSIGRWQTQPRLIGLGGWPGAK